MCAPTREKSQELIVLMWQRSVQISMLMVLRKLRYHECLYITLVAVL